MNGLEFPLGQEPTTTQLSHLLELKVPIWKMGLGAGICHPSGLQETGQHLLSHLARLPYAVLTLFPEPETEGATKYQWGGKGCSDGASPTSHPQTRARNPLGMHRERSHENKATGKCTLTDLTPEKPRTLPGPALAASHPAFPKLEASLGVSKTMPQHHNQILQIH